MPRIKLDKTEYKQINTDRYNFMFQLLDNGIVNIIKSDTKPSNDEKPIIKLKQYDGLNNRIAEGIFWGKGSTDDLHVGLLE